MGILEDILTALDRIPVWKRLQALPGEVDELKGRLASLETKMGGKWPGDVCPFCGAQALRMETNDMHGMRELWKCGECGKEKTIRHDLLGKKR